MNKTSYEIVAYKDRYYVQRNVTSLCIFWTVTDTSYLTIYYSWVEDIDSCNGYESEAKAEEAYKEYQRRNDDKYDKVVHVRNLEP